MSEQVQLRRGTTSQNAAFTGAQGELVADTQANVLVLHDGFTVGGHPIPSKAYVDTLIAGDTGNVTFSVNTVSTSGTNQDLNLTPNGTGTVHASKLTVDGTIVGNISGSAATVTTNANLTGPITSIGNATSVALQTGTGSKFVMDSTPTLQLPILISANIGTPIVGNLFYCTFPTLNQNTTGSANNAAYLGGVPAAGYELALGFTPYNSTNPAGYITVTTANVISFNGNTGAVTLSSADVTVALGFTPLDAASFTEANIIVQLGYTPYDANVNANGYITSSDSITGNANNASYLGGVPAVDYLVSGGALGTPSSGSAANLTSFPTLNQDTTGSANNASYLGGVPAADYAQLVSATFTNLSATNTITGNISGSATTALTQSPGDNTSNIATTAFVTSAISAAIPYDVSEFFVGQPTANQQVLHFTAVRPFTLLANSTSTPPRASCRIQASNSATFNIAKNSGFGPLFIGSFNFAQSTNNATFTAAEETNVTTVDDVSGSLSSLWFAINSPTTPYYVWYKVGGVGTDPAITPNGIEVDILTNDSSANVATATQVAVNFNAAFNASVSGNVVTISNEVTGPAIDANAGTSGFTINITSQGNYDSFPSNVSVAAGDVITVTAPVTPDAGMEDIGITLSGVL